ncbi:hypothetical protein L3Y19_gp096 [Gordonia phage Neville]|uniref:Uncharacterized protein n=1 Tax=Gordonia phage Neville TaxID=2301693 RepID=A0A385E0P6_9CAUD|nr:hypothetical protein L3Y19_gp096 [Gordonia phage Neville]AXQ64487.1 hypothetical protein SEA_NEVILLE_134 [Gordonia phage Neville]
MTGYNMAHGDTDGVQMNLANDQGTYTELMRCVRIAWWDDDDNTWNDVDRAATELREFVTALQPNAMAFHLTEIRDADLATVDFREIITDELEELNIQDGRERTAGL